MFVFNNIFFNEWTEEKEVQLSICFDWQNRLQKKILFCKQKFLLVNFVQNAKFAKSFNSCLNRLPLQSIKVTCLYRGIRQKQLNFRYRFLVRFKFTLKSVLLKQKLFLYLFGMNSLKKCGYKGKALLYIRQKQLNFRYRSLGQFKVTWKYDGLKCQKLFLNLFKMNSFQKCDYRGIRQKQMNFRCRSPFCVCDKDSGWSKNTPEKLQCFHANKTI